MADAEATTETEPKTNPVLPTQPKLPSIQPTPPPQPQPQPEMQEAQQALSEYDMMYIDSSNAIDNSFYLKGRSRLSQVWQLKYKLQMQYEQGAPLTNYNAVSLHNIFS